MSETTGKIEWYLARDGQQHGPLTENELDKFIELGHLRPTDLLWKAGFEDWRTALEVFPPPPPTPPLPDPTADAASNEDPDEKPEQGTARPSASSQEHSSGRDIADETSQPRLEQRSVRERIAERNAEIEERSAARAEPRLHATDGQGGARRADERPHQSDGRSDPHSYESSPRGDYQHTAASAPTQRPAQNPMQNPMQDTLQDRAQDRAPASRHTYPDDPPAGQHESQARPTIAAHDGSTAAPINQPQPIDDEDAFLDDEPEGRSGWLMVAAAMFILVIVGAGGLFAYNNQNAIAALYSDLANRKNSGGVAVVRAPTESAKEPAGKPDQSPPSSAPASGTLNNISAAQPLTTPANEPLPEAPLLKSKLWQFAQREFGEWTEKRIEYIQRLPAQDKSKENVNKYLVDSFVRFRRDNAAVALLASPASLEQIAAAFVDSLKALTAKSAQQCYAFISNGESTPEVAPLYFEPQVGTKLEAQMLAILQAVADGKTAPKSKRQPPSSEDFNKLSSELAKRGWSTADLKLFSDPDALSQAKPEIVCRLVTEWFSTQTTLADQGIRDQLIAASLRPVIGG
jgi:hypothetical protein